MEVFITNISYILAKIISEQIIFCDWLCNKTGFSHKIGEKKKLTVCTTLKHPIKSLENKEVLRQNVFISFRRKSKSQINVLVEQEKSPKNNNMY